MSEDILEKIRLNVIQGRRNQDDEGLDDTLTGEPGVEELIPRALEQEIDPHQILVDGISKGMEEVGEKYERGEYYIPDMLAAAETVEVATDLLAPHLQQEDRQKKGKMVIATVEKDYHDIGKNIVCIMLKGAGVEIIDLGVDVPANKIVEEVQRHEADIVGLSALLDTTMSYMQDTIKTLEEKGLRDKTKVVIGGAPTSPEFAEKINADAHCKDAFEAVRTVKSLTA